MPVEDDGILKAGVPNLGTLENLWIEFRGCMNLDGKKITSLFSLTSNRNLAFLSTLNGVSGGDPFPQNKHQ